MRRLLRHLELLGGMIVHPSATMARVLAGEGTLLALLPWFALVACALTPISVGQAILILRVSPLDGALQLLSSIATRMSAAFIGVLAASVVLTLLEIARTSREDRRGFDAALDLAAHTLVPYLLLATLGQLLASIFGVDLWWMAHHVVRGAFWDRVLEISAAYGWSIVLFGVALRMFLARSR